MNQDFISEIIEQLPYRLPGLIVYVTGIFVSLAWFRRCRRPALYVLIGGTMMAALSVFSMVGMQWIMDLDRQGHWWWSAFYIGMNCVDAGATAFLIWAAFADRQPYYPPEYFESGARDDYLRNQ